MSGGEGEGVYRRRTNGKRKGGFEDVRGGRKKKKGKGRT